MLNIALLWYAIFGEEGGLLACRVSRKGRGPFPRGSRGRGSPGGRGRPGWPLQLGWARQAGWARQPWWGEAARARVGAAARVGVAGRVGAAARVARYSECFLQNHVNFLHFLHFLHSRENFLYFHESFLYFQSRLFSPILQHFPLGNHISERNKQRNECSLRPDEKHEVGLKVAAPMLPCTYN